MTTLGSSEHREEKQGPSEKMPEPSERLFESSEVLHEPTENIQEFTEMLHQKKKSRFSRMCGECVHCLRKEDCGQCDFCQVM